MATEDQFGALVTAKDGTVWGEFESRKGGGISHTVTKRFKAGERFARASAGRGEVADFELEREWDDGLDQPLWDRLKLAAVPATISCYARNPDLSLKATPFLVCDVIINEGTPPDQDANGDNIGVFAIKAVASGAPR